MRYIHCACSDGSIQVAGRPEVTESLPTKSLELSPATKIMSFSVWLSYSTDSRYRSPYLSMIELRFEGDNGVWQVGQLSNFTTIEPLQIIVGVSRAKIKVDLLHALFGLEHNVYASQKMPRNNGTKKYSLHE